MTTRADQMMNVCCENFNNRSKLLLKPFLGVNEHSSVGIFGHIQQQNWEISRLGVSCQLARFSYILAHFLRSETNLLTNAEEVLENKANCSGG